MLNPSTANAVNDDPTIRRCIDFAIRWGYEELEVVNLFAFKATSPADLFNSSLPVGENNNMHILAAADRSDRIVLAWGNHGLHRDRNQEVAALLSDFRDKLFYFRLTKGGQPVHPLYLRKDLEPVAYC